MDHLSDQMVTFGLYGLEPRPNALAKFYAMMIAWMERNSLKPTLLGTSDSPRFQRFRPSAIKKMQERIDHFTHLSLLSVPDDVDHELLGRNSHASLNLTTQLGYAIVSIKERLMPMSSPDLRDLMTRLAELVRPAYGIAFRREFRYGPTYYAMAMRVGDVTDRDDVILGNHNDNHYCPVEV